MSKPSVANRILEFLNKANRPHSINEISEQCGKELGKSAIQKALDSGVERDKIVVKTFGKQKIYHIKQRSNVAEIKTELLLTQQRLNRSQYELKRKQDKWQEMQPKLRSMSNLRSAASLEEERQKLLEEISELDLKLQRQADIQAKATYTPAEAKKIEERYEDLSTAYRKRKRICNDMLDAILEGYPKPKKVLIEDIGVETDEEVGFKI